jgi:hypothetical protein
LLARANRGVGNNRRFRKDMFKGTLGLSKRRIAVSEYQIHISFGGGHVRLEIKDAAKWALGPQPGGPSAVFTAAPQNPITYNITVQQPYVELSSKDFKTPVNAFLTVFVETSLNTLTLDVLNNGKVLVECPPSGDSFLCDNGAGGPHTLKLK